MSFKFNVKEYLKTSTFLGTMSVRSQLFKALINECRQAPDLEASQRVISLIQNLSIKGFRKNKNLIKSGIIAQLLAQKAQQATIGKLCQAWIDLNLDKVIVPLFGITKELKDPYPVDQYKQIIQSDLFKAYKKQLPEVEAIDIAFGYSLFLYYSTEKKVNAVLPNKFCTFWTECISKLEKITIDSEEWGQLDNAYHHLLTIQSHKTNELKTHNELKLRLTELSEKFPTTLKFLEIKLPTEVNSLADSRHAIDQASKLHELLTKFEKTHSTFTKAKNLSEENNLLLQRQSLANKIGTQVKQLKASLTASLLDERSENVKSISTAPSSQSSKEQNTCHLDSSSDDEREEANEIDGEETCALDKKEKSNNASYPQTQEGSTCTEEVIAPSLNPLITVENHESGDNKELPSMCAADAVEEPNNKESIEPLSSNSFDELTSWNISSSLKTILKLSTNDCKDVRLDKTNVPHEDCGRRILFAYLSEKYAPSPQGFNQHLWETLFLGLNYTPDSKISKKKLVQLVEKIFFSTSSTKAIAMLLGAALIRPTLFSPHIPSDYVWANVNETLSDIPACKEFVDAILQFKIQSTPLPIDLAIEREHRTSLKKQLDKINLKLSQWTKTAPQRYFKFEDANKFWKSWTSKTGDLGKFVRSASSEHADIHQLKKDIVKFDDKMFEKAIEGESARSNHRQTIKYHARTKIKKQFDEIVELVSEKIEIADELQCTDNSSLAHSQKTLLQIQSKAKNLITSLVNSSNKYNDFNQYASDIFVEALKDLTCSFKNNIIELGKNDAYNVIAYNELLIPSLLQEKESYSEIILDSLEAPLSPDVAYKLHLKQGSLFEAKHLWELESSLHGGTEGWEKLYNDADREWDKRNKSMLISLEEDLGKNLLKGVITPEEHTLLSRDLQNLENDFKTKKNSPIQIASSSKKIKSNIEQCNLIRHKNARERLQSFISEDKLKQVSSSNKILPALHRLIDNGEYSFFDEVLAKIDEEQADEDTILSRLSPPKQLDYNQKFRKEIITISEKINNQTNLDKRPISKSLCDICPNLSDSRDALKSWSALEKTAGPKKYLNIDPKSLFTLLRSLGFQISADAKKENMNGQGAPNFWSYVTVDATIKSPLPIFGSYTPKHTCLFVWRELQDPSQLLSQLENFYKDKNLSLLIFFFSGIDLTLRDKYVRELRKKGYCPILIDRYFFTWLCNISDYGERTKALFSVGLSGVGYNPYTPEVAGAVPNEMFYGRDQDIQKLWNMDGSCIVYGGRQLGKSALLLQVKKQFHSPENKRYVFYQGMKTKDDFWKEIHSKLIYTNEFRIQNKPRNTGNIQEIIRSILKKDREMRLVFLFDECDEILDRDRLNDFDQVSAIRDLMNETGRRFKVVFAGLHSVHRFAKIPNQPLAHFGTPICVGPLEGAAAEQLIKDPMESLGYRFALDSLVHRILAHTNRHPSLIQFFCKELISAMLNRNPRGDYLTVTEDIIARVYRSADLMRRMRERFDWTLDLDKRYRAVGYAFALEHVSGERYPQKEYSVEEVEKLANDAWPQGFIDTNSYELHGLLDEMVGLGVLIRTQSNKYSLRSPNVLHLLGGEDEIWGELVRLSKEPKEDVNNSSVIHRTVISSDQKDVTISPLTLMQERQLQGKTNGVVLILGTKALGLGRIENYLHRAFTKDSSGFESKVVSVPFGKETISKLKRTRSSFRGNTYFVMDAKKLTLDELKSYVTSILAWMKNLKSDNYCSRVVIQVPLPQFQSLYFRKGDFLVNHQEVEQIILTPWGRAGIERFFDDVDIIPEANQVTQLYEETNGWPSLLSPCLRSSFKSKDTVTCDKEKLRALVTDSGVKDLTDDALRMFKDTSNYEPLTEGDYADEFGAKKQPLLQLLSDMNLIEKSMCKFSVERILKNQD